MTIPPTAVVWDRVMDPADELDWVMNLQPHLETSEGIVDFAIVLSAEAAAAGLSISTGGGKSALLITSNTQILLWFDIAEGNQADPMFDGSGTQFGMEVTFTTDATIPRIHQITYVLKVSQQ